MSTRSSEDRIAALAMIDPILRKIQSAITGDPPAAAAYALLTQAVVVWRDTGLPLAQMCDTLKLFIESSEVVAAGYAERGN